MASPSYCLHMPKTWAVPLVISAPHAGVEVPRGFDMPRGTAGQAVAAMSDTHIDQLAAPAAGALGFPLLSSHYLRAFIDLNRSVEELDPLLIDDLPGSYQRVEPGSRVAAGLGLIPRLSNGHMAIYSKPLSHRAVQSRIERFYTPYHSALQGLVDQCLDRFGTCLLIDLHSMPPLQPAKARRCLAHTDNQPSMHQRRFPGAGVNMVLGDDAGQSLAQPLSADLIRHLQQQGLTVSYNEPYAGGYITSYYGQQVPTVQLEVCRSLYPGEGAMPHAKTLERLFLNIATFAAGLMSPMQEAAE